MPIAAAFIASLGLAFLLQGARENPSRRGGFAVLCGLLAGTILAVGWPAFFTLRVFWLALAILFLMGTLDDLVVLRPSTKLLFQVAAAGIFLVLTPSSVWGGGIDQWLGWWAYALWMVWLVGVTNAWNLLDNMDGLTPAAGTVASFGFAWMGWGADWLLGPLCAALAGFLVLNAYKARIHLGDGGSHLVGFSLATLPLYGLSSEQSLLVPLVLLVPIADTAFVSTTRILRGQSPFLGGKDHLSHRLVCIGWAQPAVVSIAAGVTLFLVIVVWLIGR